VEEPNVEGKKVGKCWKCSVDTHATKDCKVQHYCLVCDTGSHPTLRYPTLRLPKPQAFVGGPACEESLCMRLPDSVFKAHLAPKGSPTALIKITGGSASAESSQSVMARICPLSSQWKWEAIPHGEDAFLVSFPTVEDLQRRDGFQLGVPNSSAQMTFSVWKAQDVPHSFELQPVWVHVDGVPHTVRYFLGLWAVGSLIGTTLDVDLVSLRSLGVVRILVAMMEPKNLDKFHEVHGCACLGVTVTVKLKGYDLYFRREQPDFVVDPGFTPFFWRKKGDDSGNDGAGPDADDMDAPRRNSNSAARMDIDNPQSSNGSSHGNTVMDGSSCTPGGDVLSSIAVTPLNPYPTTPRGKEIVAAIRSKSPQVCMSSLPMSKATTLLPASQTASPPQPMAAQGAGPPDASCAAPVLPLPGAVLASLLPGAAHASPLPGAGFASPPPRADSASPLLPGAAPATPLPGAAPSSPLPGAALAGGPGRGG
jgi:hypothetical protein